MIGTRITFRRLVRYGFIIAITLLLCGYTAWQARLLLIGPTLTLHTEPPLVSEEPTITLSGTAANIVRITLNGRQIYTDHQGNFTETVILEKGASITTLQGTDRYGRHVALHHTTVYTGTK